MKPKKPFSLTLAISSGAAALSLLLLGIVNSSASTKETYDKPTAMELNFLFHVEADMAEQDVFIEHQKDSNVVYRATRADRDRHAPLF